MSPNPNYQSLGNVSIDPTTLGGISGVASGVFLDADGTNSSVLVRTNDTNAIYVDKYQNMGVNTTSPNSQLDVNSATGDCLQLTRDGSNVNKANFTVNSSGNLTMNAGGGSIIIDSSDHFDVAGHNGTDAGLKLGGVLLTATASQLNSIVSGAGAGNFSNAEVTGDLTISSHDGATAGLVLGSTLVTATASELNYLTDVTAGTASPSRALVLDGSSNASGVNVFGATRLSIEGEQLSGVLESWTPQTSITSNTWKAVAYSPSLNIYVAIASNNANTSSFASSTDGLTWTIRTAPASKTWNDVVWNEDRKAFFAVSDASSGASNAFATSTNGTSWSGISAPATQHYRAITYVRETGQFILNSTASSNEIYFSSNFTTWFRYRTVFGVQFNQIFYSRKFSRYYNMWNTNTSTSSIVTTLEYGTGPLADNTQLNGSGYVNLPVADAVRSFKWGAESLELGVMVLVATDTNSASQSVAYSTNGVVFTYTSASEAASWSKVIWVTELSMFVAISSDATPKMMKSTDGINWSSVTLPAGLTALSNIAWIPETGTFMLVSSVSGSTYAISSSIVSSTSIINFTKNQANNTKKAYIRGDTFLTFNAGAGAYRWLNDSLTSTSSNELMRLTDTGLTINGSQFSAAALEVAPTTLNNNRVLRLRSSANGHFYDFTLNTSGSLVTSLSSGTTTAITMDHPLSIGSTTSINSTSTTSGQLIVKGGIGLSDDITAGGKITANALITQPTTAYTNFLGGSYYLPSDLGGSSPAQPINEIAWSPALRMFVGTIGNRYTMYSYNGLTWTQGDTGLSRTWHSIVWADKLGLFVMMNTDTTVTGQVATSPDGLTWTSRDGSAGATASFMSLAWSSSLSLLVASANTGSNTQYIQTSPDGITWTRVTGPTASSASPLFRKIIWNNTLGQFVACGNGQFAVSTDGANWNLYNTATTTTTFRSIAYSPTLGRYVASSTIETSQGATSTDGITWTAITVPLFNDIIWISGIRAFVGISKSATDWEQWSANGTSWGFCPRSITESGYTKSTIVYSYEYDMVIIGRSGSFGANKNIVVSRSTSPNAIRYGRDNYFSRNNIASIDFETHVNYISAYDSGHRWFNSTGTSNSTVNTRNLLMAVDSSGLAIGRYTPSCKLDLQNSSAGEIIRLRVSDVNTASIGINASAGITMTNVTAADATSTTAGGVLTVTGGTAISKKLYVGDGIYGTIQTAAQPNITSVTTLDITGHDGATDGLRLNGTLLTATATQLNNLAAGSASGSFNSATISGDLTLSDHNGTNTGLILGSTLVTSTASELNYLSGVTPGTASASKALVLDASSNLSGINNLTLSTKMISPLYEVTDSIPNPAGLNTTTLAGLTSIQPIPSNTNDRTTVAYSPSLNRYVINRNGFTTGTAAYSSNGGTSWTSITFPNLGFTLNTWAVTWVGDTINKFFIAGTENNNQNRIIILSSSDGITWNAETTTGTVSFNVRPRGFAYNTTTGRIIAVGEENDDGTGAAVAYSDNGTSWTTTTAIFTNLSPTFGFNSVIYNSNSNIFITSVAAGFGSGADRIATSSDGLTWTMRSTPLNSSLRWKWLACDPANNIVLSSPDPYSPATVIMRSTDGGITWATVNSVFATATKVSSLSYIPEISKFLIFTSENPSTLLYSDNGLTWTSVSTNIAITSDNYDMNDSLAYRPSTGTFVYATRTNAFYGTLFDPASTVSTYANVASTGDNRIVIGSTNGLKWYTGSTSKTSLGTQQGQLDTTGLNVLNSTQSTSITSGALRTAGGLGVVKNAFIGGNSSMAGTLAVTGAVTLSNTTNSTTTSTGALILSGGAGIAQNVNIGGTLSVANVLSITRDAAGSSPEFVSLTTTGQVNNNGAFINFKGLNSSGSLVTYASINPKFNNITSLTSSIDFNTYSGNVSYSPFRILSTGGCQTLRREGGTIHAFSIITAGNGTTGDLSIEGNNTTWVRLRTTYQSSGDLALFQILNRYNGVDSTPALTITPTGSSGGNLTNVNNVVINGYFDNYSTSSSSTNEFGRSNFRYVSNFFRQWRVFQSNCFSTMRYVANGASNNIFSQPDSFSLEVAGGDFSYAIRPAAESFNFCYEVEGYLNPEYSETYTFTFESNFIKFRVWLDGQFVSQDWTGSTGISKTATVVCEANKRVSFYAQLYATNFSTLNANTFVIKWQSTTRTLQTIPSSKMEGTFVGQIVNRNRYSAANQLTIYETSQNSSSMLKTEFTTNTSGNCLMNASGGTISTHSSNHFDIAGHDGATVGLKLGGTLVTSTAEELNYVDVTPGTATASKALVLDSSLDISGINSLSATDLTGTLQTAAQPNVTSVTTLDITGHDGATVGLALDGTLVTSTAAELNYVDVTQGTAAASKALVLDSSLDISGINSLSATDLTGTLQTAAQPNVTSVTTLDITGHDGTTFGLELGGTLVTSTADELNYVDVTPGTATASKALVLDSSLDISGINSLSATDLTGTLQTAAQPNVTSVTTLDITGHDGATVGLSLDGTLVTSTADELNYVDVTPGTATASKALVLDASSDISGINSFSTSIIDITGHDGSTAGLSLDGTLVTSTAAELNYVDVTPGTATASKALVLDASSDISGINSFSTSVIDITGHDGATVGLSLDGTLVTSTAAELNYVDVTPGTATASKALVLDSSLDISGINSLSATDLTGTLQTAAQPNVTSVTTLDITGHDGSTVGLALDGTLVTSTAAELNYVDVTPGTATASKALVLDSSLDISGINSLSATDLTGTLQTAAQPNVTSVTTLDITGHDGATVGLALNSVLITSSATELNYVDVVAGTASASKALVLDASSDIAGINSLSATDLTGTLQTASQPNITSVGTLTSLIISGTTDLTGTTASTSNATGILTLTGGIGINNTTDATSSTNGGTLTSAGGAAFAKSVFVGQNLTVGGDLLVSGTTTTINTTSTVVSDNTLILNSGPVGSGYDAGMITHRYQTANNAATGDVITDTAKVSFALDGASSTTITLPNTASTVNDYYNNWWIKIVDGSGADQVRKITDYDGSTFVATLGTAFATTPAAADTVNLYNKSFTSFLWQESNKRFAAGFTTQDTSGPLTIIDHADMAVNKLISLNTTASTSNSTGGVLVSGGIAISKNTDATSSTNGGSLTSAGGAAFAKTVYVGDALRATDVYGTIQTASQPNITSVSTLNLTGHNGSTTGLSLGGTLVTATATKLNYTDVTAGTAAASKALVLDSSSDITGINSLSSTKIKIGTPANTDLPLEIGTVSYTFTGAYAYSNSNNAHGLVAAGSGIQANYSLRADGRILVTGEVEVTSDLRLKKDIEPLSLDFCKSFVMKTKPVHFNWKNGDEKVEYGYIAQEVYKAGFTDVVNITASPGLEEMIEEDGFVNPKDAKFTLSTGKIIPILACNQKDLIEKNEEQAKKIQLLEERIDRLEELLSRLTTI